MVDHYFEIDFQSWFLLKKSSELLQNLQVLWQYSWVLHLQVTTFFKYWVNTREYYHNTYKYCHNTCEYWAGEYTPSLEGAFKVDWRKNWTLRRRSFGLFFTVFSFSTQRPRSSTLFLLLRKPPRSIMVETLPRFKMLWRIATKF